MAVSGDLWARALYAVMLSPSEGHEMPVQSADALLFDLGRVVIDIDFARAFACWAGHARCEPRVLEEQFRRDISHRRHEVGEIDTREFFAGLKTACAIDISYEQFLDGWNAIFIGEMPGMADLLERAARQLPLYAFTNTNPDHEVVWSQRYAGILANFTEIFVSTRIRLRKPDAAAFDHVVKAIGVPAQRIVFFDDSIENVAGARARGLQAVHVRSTADVADTLAALGL
jgi:glucose-1-phosphatase